MFIKKQAVKWKQLLISIVSIYVLLFLFHITLSTGPRPKPDDSTEAVRIGIITCCGKDAIENSKTATETVTLIKSVLISASIWNVTRDLEFFLFVDDLDVKNMILKKVNGYRADLEDNVRLKLFFLNATKDIPSEILTRTLGPEVCVYTRLFFPHSIPDVNRILYLDTDIVVTGNIEKIWETFVNETGSERMAGMIQNDAAQSNAYLDIFADHFAKIPHVPPKGLNAGVMFMNLEEMRKYNWTTKALDVYRKYKPGGKYASDQQVINILFNSTPDALKQFPCQFNFQHLHCDRGWYCDGALEDLDGVQIMHGAGGHFEGGSHSRLYKAYRDFDLHNYQNVSKLLIKPLRQFYSDAQHSSLCHERLGKQLFKSFPI